ncbi:MAG: ATP-binding cassette domain-containing protein [Acholeplasmataceae bacterium]|nr:ATP-binding cassette domain-containing protein [Acholeplasmataceae bacterium]MDD4468910.1 ATP-binding cassette domain-containing protein [Acholeplasmataceae bacterium]
MTNKVIIELDQVSKRFDDSVIVNNISLKIYENEFITLLGPSGCGKTTTLRMIGGFETPSSGNIIIEGKVFNDLPPYARPNGTRVGMYNVSRYAYAVSNIYNGFNPNEINNDLIDLAFNTLIKTDFTEWGFDTLKKGIVANNLDLAFVYTGDFLDMLYTKMDDGYSLEEINFDIYIPDDTIAFMDFLVIPKKARHVNIAHEFINFMLDPNNAYNNASVVGYATPLQNAYNRIVNHLGDEDTWLNSWAYANLTYYPTPKEDDIIKYKGTPLANFEQAWLDKINTMVNNVKAN